MAEPKRRSVKKTTQAQKLTDAFLAPLEQRRRLVDDGAAQFAQGQALVAEGEQLMTDGLVALRKADIPVAQIAENTGLSAQQIGRMLKRADGQSQSTPRSDASDGTPRPDGHTDAAAASPVA